VNNHWQECSCGAKKDSAPHAWSAKSDVNSHWLECPCGAKKDTAPHTWATKSDDNNHWQECSCGEKQNLAFHSWSAWTVTVEETTTSKGAQVRSCSVCKATETQEIPMAVYTIVQGAGSLWSKTSTKQLTFRCDGDYFKFAGILVDAQPLASGNYTSREDSDGSSIAILKSAYLESLALGSHKLTFVYANGNSNTVNFTIRTSNGVVTGDNNPIVLLAVLLVVSAAGIGGTIFALRKSRKK